MFAFQLRLEVWSAVVPENVCVHTVSSCHLESPFVPNLYALESIVCRTTRYSTHPNHWLHMATKHKADLNISS